MLTMALFTNRPLHRENAPLERDSVCARRFTVITEEAALKLQIKLFYKWR